MNQTIVCKFGGSSLADAAGFSRVREILLGDERRRFVVVSAPGKRGAGDAKVTDLLLRAGEGDGAALEEVCARFRELAEETGVGNVEAELRGLRAALGEKARLVSRGEWLCARLLARYLLWRFCDAEDLIFLQDGRPDREPTEAAIRALSGTGCVIPGFYGRDERGGIALLPRGGSDVSGALAAAALGATLYENWTDVDGFHTADPAVVPDSLPIPSLSYEQAHLFCRMGAKVLQSESLFPAARAGVPIRVRSTFRPEKEGTLVSRDGFCPLPFLAARTAGREAVVSLAGADEALTERVVHSFAAEKRAETLQIRCAPGEEHALMRALHGICFPHA